MKVYGLIGYPLGHSFSKKYFTEKFEKERITDCTYELFPLEDISLLPGLFNINKEIRGLNVTIPYKEKVIEYLDEMDETAIFIGAVNCIKIIEKKEGFNLKGYNTDAYGFEISLKKLLEPHHKKALILGTGGASKAVKFILNKLKIEYILVSRTPKEKIIGYNQITKELLDEYTIIINTSPLGMYPDEDSAPDIPYNNITGKHLLYDLVYNPSITRFMKLGKDQGAKTENGLAMLYGQAEKAWEIWNS